MAKVRKFEDMDSMVRRAMAIEREVDEAKSIQHVGASGKRKKSRPSSISGKKQRTSTPQQFYGQGCGYQGQGQGMATSQIGPMTCYHCHNLDT